MATLAELNVLLTLKDQMTSGLQNASSKLNKVAGDFRKVGAGFTAGVTLPIVAGAAYMVNAASDLNEAQSAVNTVFGDSASIVTDYSKTSAKSLGVSQEAYLSSASSLGALFTGMGLSDKTSADFSTNMLQAASDLGSFYNVDPGTAMQDLQSGLVGEAEPLRKYGILITEASVAQKAMAQTGKTNANQLTESEKVTARYALIQEQLGAAQGDFARTSGGLANTMRILKAQLINTAAAMGQILLPYVLKAATKIKELMERFDGLSDRAKKFIVIGALIAASIGPILIGIGLLIPALTALGAVLLFLLSPIGLVVAALVGLAALAAAAYFGNWYGFADAVNWVADAFMRLISSDTVTTFLDGLEKAVMRPVEAFKKMGEAIGGIATALISGDFSGALQQLQKLIAGFGDLAASPAKAIGSFIQGIRTGFAPLDAIFSTVGKLFTDFGRMIQEIFQGDLSGAAAVAERMFGHLGDLGKQAWALLKAGFDAINWGAVWDTVKAKMLAGIAALADIGAKLWAIIKAWFSGIDWGGIASDVGAKAKAVGGDLITGLISGIANAAGGIKDAILGPVTAAINAAIDVANKVPGVDIGHVGGGGGGGGGIDQATMAQQLVEGTPAPSIPLVPGQVGSNEGVTPKSPLANIAQTVKAITVPPPNTTAFDSAMTALQTRFNSTMQAIVSAASAWSIAVGANIGAQFGTMVANTAALLTVFQTNFATTMDTALQTAATASTGIQVAVSTNIGTMVGTVTGLMTGFSNAVGQGMSDALSAASTYSNAIYVTVSNNIGMMVGNVAALVGAIPGIVVGAMNDAASSGGAAAYNAGQAIGAGLANGLASMVGQVQAQAAALANAATAAAAAALQVKSPSRVFHKLGAYVGEGFALGIQSRYGMASAAGNGLAASAIPGISGSGSGGMGGRGGFSNYGTIRVEAPSPEDFYVEWRKQQMSGVRR